MEDKLKFKDSVIFKEYKEEIVNDEERYKPVLLELLKENRINSNIYMSIIKLWEKGWKEEANIYIDKLKFDKCTFKNCKEEIINNKERYKPALLKVLEEDKVNSNIKKEILEIWEDKWKEGSNEYITKLRIEIDKVKFRWNLFEEYKGEIRKNKERYKPALLKALEEDEINCEIYKKIVKIWEEEWKEGPNIYIDKLKFDKYIFKNCKEEIINDKERYKLALLKALEENKIDFDIYKDIVELWENEWKEEANIYIDKLKFYYDYKVNIFKEYKEEISKDKERYKSTLLGLLEEDKIEPNIFKEIIAIWEDEWKEEANEYIDELKFKDSVIFKEYKEEISKDKERYKSIFLELLDENKIADNIYLEIIDILEKEWKEKPNVEIDKLIFGGWYFDEDYEDYLNFDEDEDEDDYYNYIKALKTKRLIENPKRYKPVLLKLLEENIDTILSDIFLCSSVIRLWEWEWKEEPNIDIDKLKFYDEDSFYDFEEEIIANPKRYKPALLELILEGYDELYDIYSDVLDEWEEKELEI